MGRKFERIKLITDDDELSELEKEEMYLFAKRERKQKIKKIVIITGAILLVLGTIVGFTVYSIMFTKSYPLVVQKNPDFEIFE